MDERVLAERLITYDTSTVDGIRAAQGFVKGWLEAREIDVHDHIHNGLPVLSAHVVVGTDCFTDGHAARILDQLQECVAEHFDIAVEHSTFQVEPHTHFAHERAQHV